MTFTYRSVQIGYSGIWTAQAYFDDGSNVVHQVIGVFSNQAAGQAGAMLSARAQADAACQGSVAARGGTFQSTNTNPFVQQDAS